jgi:CIC family chloride channel protein
MDAVSAGPDALPRKAASKIRDRVMFLSLMGVVVGICGGLIAEFLLRAINFITDVLFYGRFSRAYLPPNAAVVHWWMPLLPAAGGLLVGILIHYFSPEIKGDGIPAAMTVVLTNRSIVKPRVGFFKPLSAAITVGSGGPFGAEGPIIQTGAAIGSIISQFLPASASERRTLLACGAAAGLAGVFKTPFAGVMLAVELLVFEFRARSFIPIALASASGTLVAMGFRGSAPVFPVEANYHFQLAELPFFILLAVGCALLAWLMTRTLYFFEEVSEYLERHIWFPAITMFGGLLVGLIAIAYPEVLGTGYSVIADLLARPHPLHQLLGIGAAKLLAFGIALGSGSSGGTFAPALMIGGSLGAAFGSVVHMLMPGASSVGLYGMVATAALFGSIYRATPSAILFMLEVTGAYRAMLPLFMVAIVADLTVHYLMEHTINTERLVRQGISVPNAYTADPMRILHVRDIMNASSPGTPPSASLAVESVPAKAGHAEVLAALMAHETVPVVDGAERVIGVLSRNEMLRAGAQDGATAGDLCRREFMSCSPDELVYDVALRLLASGADASPVMDPASGKLIGIVTSYDLLRAKEWENLQEMREPGTLSLFPLLSSRGK